MPGIFGCISRDKSDLPPQLDLEMRESLMHEKWYESSLKSNPDRCIGSVSLGVASNRDSYAESNGITCVVSGNIYDKPEPSESNSSLLLEIYRTNQNDISEFFDGICALHGSFVFSIHDRHQNRVMIGTDKLGTRPLYYTLNRDRFLYSSEVKTLLKDPLEEPKLNKSAVYLLLTFSFLLDNKTYFEGIDLVPPGTTLVYNADTDDLETVKYWNLDFTNRDTSEKSLEQYYERFSKLLEQAIERRINGKRRIGIFLSGGLDSRLVAGFTVKIAAKKNLDVIAYTLGYKNGRQERIARTIASRLGIKFKFYQVPSNHLNSYSKQIVYRGDGQVRIRDAHFISIMDDICDQVDVVLVGFFCGEIFGEVLTPGYKNVTNRDELANYLIGKYEVKRKTKHMAHLLSNSFSKTPRKDAINMFAATVEDIPHKSLDDIMDYWYLTQRNRHYGMSHLWHMSWFTDVRTPFLDLDLHEFALSLPIDLRIKKKFIRKASRYLLPKLSDIPWEKTGASPDSGKIDLFLSKLLRGLEMWPKALIERLSRGTILFKPRDYRGYDYLMRTSAKDYVWSELLCKNQSGAFNLVRVKQLLEDHMRCKDNIDQLLCDILNITHLSEVFFNANKAGKVDL